MDGVSDKYSVIEFLHGLSPLITEEAMKTILAKRRLSGEADYNELEEKERDLVEAEAYYWLSNLPVGGNAIKDVDGNYTHSEGGWQVSSANIAEWRSRYVFLRNKWQEDALAAPKPFRIINF